MKNFKEPRIAKIVLKKRKKRIGEVSPTHLDLVKAIVLRQYGPQIKKKKKD